MKQVSSISLEELQEMAKNMYGDLVKAVVDITTGAVVVDAEMHYDEEQFLLENGSKNLDLWGINLYPSEFGTVSFIEFDSMINIRPSHDNSSRGVESPELRAKITSIITGVVHE